MLICNITTASSETRSGALSWHRLDYAQVGRGSDYLVEAEPRTGQHFVMLDRQFPNHFPVIASRMAASFALLSKATPPFAIRTPSLRHKSSRSTVTGVVAISSCRV